MVLDRAVLGARMPPLAITRSQLRISSRAVPAGWQRVPAGERLQPRSLARRTARASHTLRISCLRSGPMSSYNKVAPMTAWSPLRSLQSLSKFFIISGAATASAWYAHPHLLNLAAHVLNLDFKDNVTAFQTSFFSFLSLVFAIYSGNTMAFLYDRQKGIVEKLYAECMALEELLEEAVNTLGPDARDILGQIRLYIDREMYMPENQSPPLGEGHALNTIRAKARNYRRAGTDVGEILQASQRLAHAQSARQATACRLLPPVHWALLYTIGALFVSTFILFETGGSFSNEGRHILFTVLCGLMSFVLVALRDLADPVEGVYNATALLAERMTYINSMLNKYEKLPSRAPTSAALLGTSVPLLVEEGASSSGAELVERLPEDEGRPGLIGALAGLINPDSSSSSSSEDDSGSSSGGSNGSSSSGGGGSALSQIGAAVLGGGNQAASEEARPPVPSSMAQSASTSEAASTSAAAFISSEAPSGERPLYNQQAVASTQEPTPLPRFDSGVRSSNIVEKRPSFKVRQQAPVSAGAMPSQVPRRLLRVSSLEEQVASLAQNSAPAYRWPANAQGWSRPSASVR